MVDLTMTVTITTKFIIHKVVQYNRNIMSILVIRKPKVVDFKSKLYSGLL